MCLLNPKPPHWSYLFHSSPSPCTHKWLCSGSIYSLAFLPPWIFKLMLALDNQIAFISVNESGFFKLENDENYFSHLKTIGFERTNQIGSTLFTHRCSRTPNVIKLISLIHLNYCFLKWYSVHFLLKHGILSCSDLTVCFTIYYNVSIYIYILYFQKSHLHTLPLCLSPIPFISFIPQI